MPTNQRNPTSVRYTRWASAVFLMAALCSSILPSCVTVGRQEALEERVRTLEKFKSERQRSIESDLKRLENLKGHLDKTAAKLREQGAMLGATLDTSSSEQRTLKGKLEEVDFLVTRMTREMDTVKQFLEDKIDLIADQAPEEMPKEPDAILAFARKKVDDQRYSDAMVVLRIFLRDHKAHAKTPEARLLLGECYRFTKKFQKAIAEYHSIFKTYPKAPQAASALYFAGLALEATNKCQKAVGMFRFLVQSYRKAKEAPLARKKLSQLKCK